MDKLSLTCCTSCFLLVILLCSTTKACIQDSDCGDVQQHCCKSHCTSSRINCNKICFRDEDCSRDYLCTQNMCMACSKRYDCELKSCFNDSDCPSSHRCSNHMCKKIIPPKQNFSLLPFIIIISVLGFALLVLCYTEGCWKEIITYLKRYFGRYGRIARDECEADQRDFGESERGSHRHSNKSCVDPQRIAATMSSHTLSELNHTLATRTDRNSPNTLRNTQVISHNNETLTMFVPESIPSQSRPTLMTSCTSSTRCQQDEQVPNSVDSGCVPSLSNTLAVTRNNSPFSPNNCSLFSEEGEEPPPKYEDVVNNMNACSPVCIEMQSMRSETVTTNHYQNTETTV